MPLIEKGKWQIKIKKEERIQLL